MRTFSYPALHVRNAQRDVENLVDNRVPWDVLVWLREHMPNINDSSGYFASIKMKVQELYDSASKWQNSISSLTCLSLRGGNKRVKSSQKCRVDTFEGHFSRSDYEKIVSLSKNSILLKVTFNMIIFKHVEMCHSFFLLYFYVLCERF